MGIEAANYVFCSKEPLLPALNSFENIKKGKQNKYFYKKKDAFWIDLDLSNSNTLYIRITLCNPQEEVLTAFKELISFLFSINKGELLDLKSKKVYTILNEINFVEITESYSNQRLVFEQLYGKETAPINSDEFYKRLTQQ